MTAPARPDVESGECEHCHQQHPLWRYRPDHETHWDMTDCAFCRWCMRGEEQALLCASCYDAEREREANTPMPAADQAAIAILAGLPLGHDVAEDPAVAHEDDLEPVPPVRGQLALDEGNGNG